MVLKDLAEVIKTLWSTQNSFHHLRTKLSLFAITFHYHMSPRIHKPTKKLVRPVLQLPGRKGTILTEERIPAHRSVETLNSLMRLILSKYWICWMLPICSLRHWQSQLTCQRQHSGLQITVSAFEIWWQPKLLYFWCHSVILDSREQTFLPT